MSARKIKGLMKSWKDNVSFMLVEHGEPGNIGAAARALKSMGFRNLELIKPGKFHIQTTLRLLEYIPRGARNIEKKIITNLKHLLGRAGLTEWKLKMLHGICRQIEKKIGKSVCGRRTDTGCIKVLQEIGLRFKRQSKRNTMS